MADHANDKPATKYQVELIYKEFSPQKGGYLRLTGKTRTGKQIRGVLFEGVAMALEKQLGSIIPPGENVASMNLVVDLVGRWIERSAPSDGSTQERKSDRYFRIHEFDVLEGRSLELARIKREAARALDVSQKVVDVESAYHVLAEFAARIGGVPFDPSVSAYLVKANDTDLGDDHSDEIPATDPEEEAARRYEEQDRVSGLTGAILDAPDISVETAGSFQPQASEKEDASFQETVAFTADDEMVLEGSIENADNAQEMEAFTLEDDSPFSVEPVATEDEEPVFTTETDAAHETTGEIAAETSLVKEEVKEEEPIAPAIPARPSAPPRPAPPSRVPPRSPVQTAPGPRR